VSQGEVEQGLEGQNSGGGAGVVLSGRAEEGGVLMAEVAVEVAKQR
jgi:hypothetical protein